MSDDDAAKDKTNTDAEATTKAAAESDAERTAKVPAQSEAAEPTVKLETAPPTQAEAAASEPKAEPAAEPKSGDGKRSWLPITAAFVAGVLLVAAVTAIVVFWKQAHDRKDELAARAAATRAACDFGNAVGAYDSKNLDDYFKRVNDLSTGEWAQFFGSATDALKQAMQSVQARSTVDEIHCAWESGNDSEANVVVMITQQQSNAATPQPQTVTLPGVAHMEKKDGRWLISKFDSPVSKGSGGAAAPGAPVAPGDAQQQSAPAPSPAPATPGR
ncbi:hypothetical protein ACFYTQ_08700 [Nocardia sp. NPDC004068]|uniref:hypothetical protein n=1 Tax=Nocardia sp. NPDC004068 TaxID=3364303 RepID=UPI0036D11613